MRLISRAASLFRNLLRKPAVERELDEELRAALEALADRHVAAGMTRPDALRAARLELGGIEQVKEEVRDGRAGAALDAAMLDARYAARTLAKSPGLTAVIVATLALGIGANSAIFSVVHTLLMAPLPYRDADRLVFIWSDMTDAGYPRAPLSGPELADLRTRSTTCSGFGAIWANTIALTGDREPEQLRIGLVTDNFFDVLGAAPALGRTFRADDAVPGARPTILLSHALFTRRYGADPSIVGRQILVNDRPATVIGVMPPHFRLLLPPDSSVPDDLQAWQPFGAGLVRGPRGQQYLRVVGRMRPGVTIAAARADISSVAAGISREFSEYGSAGRILNTVPLQQDAVREMRPALVALFAGVAILLVTACMNIASLLIARAVARSKETALRVALGASRGRLLRQCTIEGAMIAALGLIAGIPAGVLVLRALHILRPASLSRIELSRFDTPVLLFTAAIAVAWGFLLSLAPMVEVLKADAAPALQRQGRAAGGPVRYRARAALVVVQIALGVVLLSGAALLVRTFTRIQQVDPGFTSDRALTFRVAVPFQRYRPPSGFNAFSRELERVLSAIPGVTSVGAISHLPYDDLPNWGGGYLADTNGDAASAPNADYRTVTPNLFTALGVRVLEGRGFTESDEDRKNPVVIVDDRLARRLWPGRSAIDQHLLVDPGSNGAPTQKVTVVGVVPHLRLRSLVADLTEQVFFPERLVLRNPMAYVVRTDGDPAALAADVRTAIAALDPKLPIYDVRTLDSYVENARATRRFTMQLAAVFAAIALVLACIGVYGVLAYSVARRRHEFGLRLALGAAPHRVVGDVMGEGMRLAAAGSLAGIIAALAASRLLASQLYGIRPHDPISYLATVALLAVAAVIACWIPARRATAVSPMEALRTE
jgi:putative ABC transport system permease protein